jgi:hypothetical protein
MKFKFTFTAGNTQGRGVVDAESITLAFGVISKWLKENFNVHTISSVDLMDRKTINEYTYDFISECPVNGKLINYRLVIRSEAKILCEHIETRCAMHRKGFHEDIAADLKKAFPGEQKLTARHGRVQVKTIVNIY